MSSSTSILLSFKSQRMIRGIFFLTLELQKFVYKTGKEIMINVQSSFCPFSNEKFNETKNKLALRKYIKIQPYVSLCHTKNFNCK
jgi:hypothetical protein